jgi:hypothetical protein
MWTAILSALGAILSILRSVGDWVRERALVVLGQKSAAADAYTAAEAARREAERLEEEAAKGHAADPSDDAFLDDFKRDD